MYLLHKCLFLPPSLPSLPSSLPPSLPLSLPPFPGQESYLATPCNDDRCTAPRLSGFRPESVNTTTESQSHDVLNKSHGQARGKRICYYVTHFIIQCIYDQSDSCYGTKVRLGDVATGEAFFLRATRCYSAGGPGMACRGQEYASKPSAQR